MKKEIEKRIEVLKKGCGFRGNLGRECRKEDLCVCCIDDLDKLKRMLEIWEEKNIE